MGLHLPKNPLGHVAREGRQHRDHPQRAHPLHDPVLGERRRERVGGEDPPPLREGLMGTTGAWGMEREPPSFHEHFVLEEQGRGLHRSVPSGWGALVPPVPAGRAV